MQCPVCHNDMHHKNVQHFQIWENNYVLFENIPALVCDVCGETLFTPEIVDKINQSLWKHEKPRKKVELDVYSLNF